MEGIDRSTRKTNRITPSTSKSTRNLTTTVIRVITSQDNVEKYSAKRTENTEQDSMDIWVKEEVLDQVEQTMEEDNANFNTEDEDCEDDGESEASYLFTDQKIFKDEHSSEFVQPDSDYDDVSSVSQASKISLLEKQLELSNARNLELEKIVHEQKFEIEQLRIRQKSCGYCSVEIVKKKTDNDEVRTDQDLDENVTVCSVCKKDLTTIRRKADRIRHLRACRNGSKFKCPYCILTYTRKHDLMKHLKKSGHKK